MLRCRPQSHRTALAHETIPPRAAPLFGRASRTSRGTSFAEPAGQDTSQTAYPATLYTGLCTHKVLGRAPSTRMFIPRKVQDRAPSTRISADAVTLLKLAALRALVRGRAHAARGRHGVRDPLPAVASGIVGAAGQHSSDVHPVVTILRHGRQGWCRRCVGGAAGG
eukprot:scaffold16112_cov63-Phaeocystis_antarctica.AAC.1